jgi:hypothetical protein
VQTTFEELEEEDNRTDDSFTNNIMQLTGKIPELSKEEFKKLTCEIMDKIFPKRNPADVLDEQSLVQQVLDNISKRYSMKEDPPINFSLSSKGIIGGAGASTNDNNKEKYRSSSKKTVLVSPKQSQTPSKYIKEEISERPLSFGEKSDDKNLSGFGAGPSDEKRQRAFQVNDMPLQMRSFSVSDRSHSNISLCKITPIRPKYDGQRIERFVLILALTFERTRIKRF